MTDRTLTAMYDTRGAAETAHDQLIELGVAVDAVAIRGVEGGETAAPSTTAAEDRGFWASLSDLFMPDEDRHTYAEGLKRGGYLLSARVPDGLQDAAADILEAFDPIDLDQRSETWRQGGWSRIRGIRGRTSKRRPMARVPAWPKLGAPSKARRPRTLPGKAMARLLVCSQRSSAGIWPPVPAMR